MMSSFLNQIHAYLNLMSHVSMASHIRLPRVSFSFLSDRFKKSIFGKKNMEKTTVLARTICLTGQQVGSTGRLFLSSWSI